MRVASNEFLDVGSVSESNSLFVLGLPALLLVDVICVDSLTSAIHRIDYYLLSIWFQENVYYHRLVTHKVGNVVLIQPVVNEERWHKEDRVA